MKSFLGTTAIAPVLSAAAAAAQTNIKIGVMTDICLYADLAGSVLAARMAAADLDHQKKADIGANLADRFDVEKVDGILDTPNSGVALAVNEITENKNKVATNSGAASSDFRYQQGPRDYPGRGSVPSAEGRRLLADQRLLVPSGIPFPPRRGGDGGRAPSRHDAMRGRRVHV
jgi:hypothetical protein